jgi:undecaprenyl-diphosphatase
MMDYIKDIDQQLFIFINNGMSNVFFDLICPFMRKQSNWYLLYIVVAYFIYEQYREKSIWILLSAALLILISDQISANLIKNTVQRVRPCNDPIFKSQVRLLVGCGGGYSYLSAHAANHFAIALFVWGVFGKMYNWFLPVAVFWAAFISFSQVYVGVHYPLDVLSGAILGATLGILGYTLLSKKLSILQIKK